MRWFRKNQKLLMAVLIGFLMIAWGVLPALRDFAVGRARREAEIMGRPVSRSMFERAGRELDVIVRAGLLHQSPPVQQFIMDPESDDNGSVSHRITGDAIWRYLVLVRMAETAGLMGEEQLAAEAMEQFPEPMRDRTTFDALTHWIAIARLVSLHEQSYTPWPAELWMEYGYKNQQVQMRYVQLASEILAPLVEVTDDEVEAFYRQHKNVSPDPGAGVVGYLAPERVQLEYAVPELEKIKSGLEVSDEDVRAEYEADRERYRIEETPDDEPDDGAVQDPVPDDPADEPVRHPDGDEEQGQETEPAGDDVEGDDATPLYRPLAEVEDEIRERLLARRAEERAWRLAETVIEALDRVHTPRGEPQQLQPIAGRFGLRYVRVTDEEGGRWICRDGVRQLVPEGDAVANLVFDAGIDTGFAEIVEGRRQPIILQVLDRREPRPEPFERVHARVENDLIRARSRVRASEYAETMRQFAVDEGLQQAAQRVDRMLAGVLDPAASAGEAADGEEADAAAEEEKEAESAEDAAHEWRYLRLEESGFVSLSRPVVAGVRRSEVVRTALKAGDNEPFVVHDPGRPPASFVVEKRHGRPADAEGFPHWLANREQMEWFRVLMAVRSGRRLEPDDMTDTQRSLQQWLQGLQEQFPPPSDFL